MNKTRTRNISVTQNPRYKELEFKFLYFKIQKLINKKVNLSLKYEQLKQPEINLTLIKPISNKIIELGNNSSLSSKIRSTNGLNLGPGGSGGANTYTDFRSILENKISTMLIHILLLLKYEYLIQSENNLIVYDLLITKATVCELLAIRLFREYKAANRINLLFINPLKQFNTIELAILTKSKKFLSQPIIIKIFEKFYNGDLIINNYDIGPGKTHEGTSLLQESQGSSNGNKESISNYKYQRVNFKTINYRSEVVPKYQSLVINLKNFIFTVLNIMIVLNQYQDSTIKSYLEIVYFIIGINFNYEFFIKIFFINRVFLKKILWFYIDFFIVLLIDVNLLLRLLVMLNKVDLVLYNQVFSLLSILLIPRNLSVFNNYRFFNLIVLSFKKMLWNMMGLFCLFLSLIIGFYISFISLNFNRSNYEIAYDLLQIFFGFTPAVWSNWDTYTSIGKFIQIAYLFLSQFIISTILAIVLSEIFSDVALNIHEDFEYFKCINLVIYFKTSKLPVNKIDYVIKFPILLLIYIYELVISYGGGKFKTSLGDKKFTFLSKEFDYYGDNELVGLDYANDDSDMSLLIKSRKGSGLPGAVFPNTTDSNTNGAPVIPSGVTSYSRRYSQVDAINANSQFAASPPTPSIGPNSNSNTNGSTNNNSNNAPQTPGLVPIQSISTLGNFKSASTDSLFIDDILSRKYGMNLHKQRITTPKTKDLDLSSVILEKLTKLEEKFDRVNSKDMDEINQSILNDVDNNSVNLYNIQEASFDDIRLINSELSLDDDDDLGDFDADDEDTIHAYPSDDTY